MKFSLAAVFAASLSCSALSAHALKTDDNTLVEGAKLCTSYLPREERHNGIPEHLLAAIASTESGRFHKALGLNLPWPWTINVEGTGYFFDTKEEAIQAVRSFQARGISSIDVGCMQVNLYHHPKAFATLDQAFDPAYNVAYGAQFLKQNFQEEGNWRKATADYHSHTPMYGEQYAGLVYGAWERIINKVADARAGRPVLNTNVANASHKLLQTAHIRVYHPMHLHDISVAHEDSREKGVLIVRPAYDSQPAMQKASLETESFVVHPAHKTVASPERSAIAPEGVTDASSADANHGAQIIKVHSDGSASNKGQFEPSSHITRVNDGSTQPSAVSVSDSVTTPAAVEAKSPFVFNN